ncbi:MAG: ABC transporter substrate-binding protein [Burkholderiales bacterium]|nr:ABC transporter substrate-binding protein [Burkholderiales bacterium]
MKIVARAAGTLLLLFSFAAQAADIAPDALVKTTVGEVLDVIRDAKDRRALYDLAEKKVLPNFDFQAMTRLAVGRSWREASSEQQKRLEDAFRGLLVNTYVTALSTGTGDTKVDVRPLQIKSGQDDVMVRTFAIQSGRKPVSIDYRMAKSKDGWKVYDVIVENLSLVTNYRGSFSSEISRSGIDGLIKTLETKNKQLEAS